MRKCVLGLSDTIFISQTGINKECQNQIRSCLFVVCLRLNQTALFLHEWNVLLWHCRYMKYGSGPARFPLPDMLQYVLEFITTKPAGAVSSACVSSTEDSQVVDRQSQGESLILGTPSQPDRLVNGNKNHLLENMLTFI